MIIEKYIRQLLFQHDCVVIPDFGGFIAKYAPANVHPARHTFLPPSKEVAFNEMLRINDGLLISHVAVGEQITREQATKLVKDFVEYVHGQIWQSQKYTFEEIGVLSRNPEQKMEFEPINRINFLNDGFGLPEMSFKPIERNTYHTKVRTKDRLPMPHAADESENSTLVRSAFRRNRSLWYALGFSSLVALSAFTGYFVLNNSDKQFGTASLFNISLAKKPATVTQPVEAVKPAVNNESVTQLPPTERPVEAVDEWETVEAEPTPVKPVEEKAVEKKVTEVKLQPKAENSISTKDKAPATSERVEAKKKVEKSARYYVIVNGFSVEGNAKRFRNALLENGQKGAKVLSRGSNGLIKVSFSDFGSRADADAQLDQIKKQYPAAWVYEN